MSTIITPSEEQINIVVNDEKISINVESGDVIVNVNEQIVEVSTVNGGYPLPSTVYSVFGRTGNIIAVDGDYDLGELGDVTLVSSTNGDVLSYDGTKWINKAVTGTGTVTSVDMSVPVGLQVSGNPISTVGTLALNYAAGYSLPTTAKQTTWDTAYNDSIISASVSGTTTKTLTLNQQDGGTITASWTDIDTNLVTSVNGYVGTVVLTTSDIAEGSRLYYTETRVSNNTDVAANTAARHSAVTIGTANGLSLASQVLSLALASASTTGALNSTDWVKFNTAYNDSIVSASVSGTTTKTLTLTQQDAGTITASWTDLAASGTVTSVGASVPTGMTISGSPIVSAGTLAFGLSSGYTIPLSTQLVPSGGTAGQLLTKNSATNYDTAWMDNYADWTEQIRDTVKAEVAINKGQAVYVSGANGTNQLVSLASNTSEGTSSKTLGLAMQNLAVNGIGQIITEGLLEGLNTSTAVAGDPVWLGVSGNLIYGLTNKPVAPAHLVYIGVVTRVQSVNGEIYVKIQNGFELREIHDVLISSVANNEGLFYESSTSLWKNKSIATVLGYTPISLTSLSGVSPLSYNNTTGAFSIAQATTSANGYLSSTDWNTFNGKQAALNGTGFVKATGTTISYDNSTYYLASNPSAYIALTGLSATAPLSYNNTTGGFTISQAGVIANGYLSSTDWNTFNNKQASGNYITALSGEATASGPGSAAVTLSTPAVTGKLLTGVNITGGSISATDSILTAFGKVQNQINGVLGGAIYQSVWNASTNSPALTSGTGTKGYYYIVSVAGSTNLDGITDWQVGDWAIFNGTVWNKVDNTDAVSSVNGFTGSVSLTTSNITEGTRLYYTDVRVSANTDVAANTAARHAAVTLGTANGLSLSTQALSLGLASTSATGALSSTDWNTFNLKQAGSTNLTSLAALTYASASFVKMTASGTFALDTSVYYLASNPNGYTTNVGTVTSVAALTIGTSGTDLSSSVANSTTTPVITLNVPTASASNRGALSSADWSTFNNKQSALTNPVTGTGTTNYLPKFTGTSTIGNSQIFDDGTNVGIGTTSPNAKLEVTSRIAATNGGGASRVALNIESNGSGTSYSAINSYNYGTAAGRPLAINESGGNVMINTTTDSGYKLDVNGTGRFSGAVGINNALTITYGGGHLTLVRSGYNTFSFGTGIGSGISGLVISDNTAGTNPLIIAQTTGAATFSSGIATNGYTASTSYAALFNGSVGIGTVSPSTKMHIADSADVYYRVQNTSTTNNGYFGSDSSGISIGTDSSTAPIRFNTGASFTERMRIWGLTGNVNIGTTPASDSGYKLDVNGTGRFSGTLTAYSNGLGLYLKSTTNNGSYLEFAHNSAGNYAYIGSAYHLLVSPYNIANNLAIRAEGDLILTTGGYTPRLTIASTGAATFSSSVSVNTTNAVSTFEIGAAESDGTGSTNAVRIQSKTGASNQQLIIGINQTGTYSFLQSSQASVGYKSLALNPNGGNVGIGTTSPSGKLHIAGDGDAANLIRLQHTGTGSNGFFDFSVNSTEARLVANYSTTAIPMLFLTGATERMRITSGGVLQVANGSGTLGTIVGSERLNVNGDVYAYGKYTGTSFFESSDMRIKTLIQDNYQTKGISSITPKLYTKNGKVELGYYAQDFVGVLDSAVSKGSDDMLSLSYREVLVAKVYALEQEIKELKAKMN